MKGKRAFAGHLMALLTVLVWGATYVASDYLLESYSALQILLLRFLLYFPCLIFPLSFQLNGNSSSTPSGILINPPSSTAACWVPCLASASALLSPKPKEFASISV